LILADDGLKCLPCVFFDDVLCSYRKDVGFGVMGRCLKCRHYRRFEREMDEADAKIMDEIDEIQRTGVWK
jgi:hypothetical protein